MELLLVSLILLSVAVNILLFKQKNFQTSLPFFNAESMVPLFWCLKFAQGFGKTNLTFVLLMLSHIYTLWFNSL